MMYWRVVQVGLQAAKAANMACLITTSAYTRGDDFKLARISNNMQKSTREQLLTYGIPRAQLPSAILSSKFPQRIIP